VNEKKFYNKLNKVQKDIYDCVEAVQTHFNDTVVSKQWFYEPQAGLDGLTPMDLIKTGKPAAIRQLYNFIQTELLKELA